jgi:hypothetical protein
MIATHARNASLPDLVTILSAQRPHALDVVAPATSIRFEGGMLYVQGTTPVLSEDGVTLTEGVYRPTQVFDEGLSAKLGIPLPYLRRMRETRPDLYDANANGWLEGTDYSSKSYLLRLFKSDDGTEGVGRAMLSDKYKMIDNLDVLMSALQGVHRRGINVEIDGADLSERRMTVRLIAPEIKAYAPSFLQRYRSPFSGESGSDNPVVESGLVITNSETGGGAFSIVPRFRVLVCKNGMTIGKDAVRNVHLGGKLDEGVVNWTDETQEKNLELISLKTADAVATFLDVEYMKRTIAEIEAKAGVPVTNAVDTIKVVSKKLAFTEEQQAGILDHFIKGADTTSGGVMQAVTSYAQTVADPDAANSIEEQGIRAMELAVAAQS